MQHDERVDYPAVIGRIRSILRRAVEANTGHEVDAVGDELLAAFSDPSRAVNAAFEAQRGMRDADWPDLVRVRVRIGLHTGTPSIGVEGYTGHRPRPHVAHRELGPRRADPRLGHDSRCSRGSVEQGSRRAAARRPPGARAHPSAAGRRSPAATSPRCATPAPRSGRRCASCSRTTPSCSGRVWRGCSGDAGFEVVAQAGNAEDLLRHVGDAQARRRGRRHPHAADAHRRGAPRRAEHPGALPGHGGARAVAVRRARVRARPPLGERRGGRLPAQGPRVGRGAVRRGRETGRRGRLCARSRGRQRARRAGSGSTTRSTS